MLQTITSTFPPVRVAMLVIVCAAVWHDTGIVMVSGAGDAGANGTVVVTPYELPAAVFMDGSDVARVVRVAFPMEGENTLDVNQGFWQRFVELQPRSESGVVQPYGFAGNLGEICPDLSCMSLENSTVVFAFRSARDFDIFAPEYVDIVFGLRLTPRRQTPVRVTFEIVPTGRKAKPEAYFLSAVAIAAHVVSSFALPATSDTAPLLLSTQVTCARAEERQWIPGALYAVLPLGGDSLFERSWRLGAFLAAVYAALLLLIKFNTHACFDANRASRVREMLPYVGGQVVLFVSPGLAFASGSMLTSPRPTFQVLGAVVIGLLMLCLYALHGWLYRTPEWLYEPVAVNPVYGEPGYRTKLRTLLAVRGHWFNDHTPFRVTKIMPREVRGGDGNQWSAFALWCVNVALFVSAGLSPTSPVECVVQGACVGTAFTVSAIGTLKLQPFRSLVLNLASAAVRLAAGGGFGLMALQPDASKYVLFVLLISGTLIVVIPRCAYALIYLRSQSSHAVHKRNAALLEAPLLETGNQDGDDAAPDKATGDPEQELGGERDGEDLLGVAAGDAAPRSMDAAHHDAPLVSLEPTPTVDRESTKAPAALQSMVSDPAGSTTKAVRFAESGPADVEAGDTSAPPPPENSSFSFFNNSSLGGPEDLTEPRYIREASRTRPRLALDTVRLPTDRAWVPRERPHVRTHNDPDLPLPAAFDVRMQAHAGSASRSAGNAP